MSVESRGESSLIKMQKEEEKKKRERDLVKNACTASATESATPLDAQGHHVRVSPVLSHFQVEERISTVSSRTTRTPQPPSTFSLPVSFLRSFQCAEFSNGVTIISLYLNPLPGAEASSVPPLSTRYTRSKKKPPSSASLTTPSSPPRAPAVTPFRRPPTHVCLVLRFLIFAPTFLLSVFSCLRTFSSLLS
ncbi:hypothetical protein B0H14DRAFT_3731897 [Mycena olivaceomarginata]|nr:hypothetical protein B0H14DRAFT_3731897 [Mycena olivaceomarginata]